MNAIDRPSRAGIDGNRVKREITRRRMPGSTEMERQSGASHRATGLLRVIELQFLGGLGLDETAEALKVFPDTVKRNWRLSRAWLHKELATNRQP